MNMTDTHQTDALQVLTFDIGETFALEAGLVREVLDPLPETAVPGAAPYVNAVVNFRGRVIPLVDLRLAFGMAPATITRDSRIVVIEHDVEGEPTMIGLRADKVHEVTSITEEAVEEAPRVGMRWRQDFIRKLARRDGDLIVIPDLAAIFAARGRTSATVTAIAPHA
jgi:purine-binding chemotaxis protein CheW